MTTLFGCLVQNPGRTGTVGLEDCSYPTLHGYVWGVSNAAQDALEGCPLVCDLVALGPYVSSYSRNTHIYW